VERAKEKEAARASAAATTPEAMVGVVMEMEAAGKLLAF
jgi:hypothetical protein